MSKRPGIEDIYPLTALQEGLLFHTLSEEGAGTYLGQLVLTLEGEVDEDALATAWNDVVQRHPALRAAFVVDRGEKPLQVIRSRAPLALHREDWRGEPEEDRRARLEAYLAADRARGMELARPPLMRLALFRADERLWHLVWSHLHLIVDGWSVAVIFREVLALYAARREGREPRLPAARPFRDYLAWLERQDPNRSEAYWRSTLAGFAAPTALPLERAARAGVHGAEVHGERETWIEGDAAAALLASARARGLTPGTLVQGAWALLLAQGAGERDVAFGVTVSGRPAELDGVDDMVGLFINTLPLRVAVDPARSAGEWLAGVQAAQAELREHEHTPLPQVQRWSQVAPGRPLFESIFSFANYPVEASAAGAEHGFRVAEFRSVERDDYPLFLAAAVIDGRLRLELVYHRARFAGAAVETLLERLRALVVALAADPARPLGELLAANAGEAAAALALGRGPVQAWPRDLCIHERIAARAAETPDALAVAAGDERLTFAELDERAAGLARRLRARGVGPETRVALHLERGADMAVALLAVLKAGGAFVPLDPAYPAERLAFLLADCGARVVLTQSRLAASLPPHGAAVLCVDEPASAESAASTESLGSSGSAGSIESTASAESAESTGSARSGGYAAGPENLAYVIYTSGSTGLPKGVMVSHASLMCYADAARARLELTADERFLQFASPGFDVMVEEVFPAWLAGGAVVFPRGGLLETPDELLRVIAEQGVTALELPTAFWHEWVRTMEEEGLRVPECVRLVIVGGERMLPERLAAWARQRVPLYHVFGLTETTVSSLFLRVEAGEDASGYANLPVGRPMANVELCVLDEALRPAAPGAPGELFVGGVAVARGYAGRPALTAERFVPDPFSSTPGARTYRTGDRVRWVERAEADDSRTGALTHSRTSVLEFLGRIDEQVKVRGFRVEPGEIEAALATHPAVGEAVVVAREDAPGQKQLAAYVVPAAGWKPGLGGLHRARLELWPSHGEAGYYDDLIYKAMAEDHRRNRGYLEALRSVAKDKVVVDVGTGAEVVLSRLALEAGARKVYAIETKEESYRQAQALVRRLGLEDRIVLVKGNALEVRLPEQADVCVSELIGCIGGSEGAVAILNTVWRLLKPGAVQVPRRCATLMAAVELPGDVHEAPALEEIAAWYAEKIFEAQGHRQDVKMCVRNFPREGFLSETGVFEDLLFTEELDAEYARDVELPVTRDGRMDGFLMWIQLYMWDQVDVDSLEHDCCWLPMFFPAFYPGVQVRAGDVLRARVSIALAENGVHPEYTIQGAIHRVDGAVDPFTYFSAWRTPPEEPSPFHRRIFGDGEPRIARPDAGKVSLHVSTHELREHLTARLPAHMVPSVFVALERLPLTPHGKLDRRALPAPDEGKLGAGEAYEAPRTPVEETLCRVWGEVLRVERVGVHDNFFELGGDSILSIQIVARARKAGLQLRPRQIFLNPTVAAVSREVVAADAAPAAAAAAPAEGEAPLTPIQHDFFAADVPDRHHWNMPLLLELRRPVESAVLEAALWRVMAHHDALRLRYTRGPDGAWRQAYAPEAALLPVERQDLSWVPEWELAAEIERRSAAVQGTLDLERGPLFRALLLEPGNGRPSRLLLVAHHLAMDGVSWRVLLEDLETAYGQLLRGAPVILPEPTTSFGEWARRLAAFTAGGGFDGELAYWTDEARRGVAPLPVDFAEGENPVADARAVTVELDEAETRALLHQAPAAYRTQVNDLLLAALARAFAAWTGEPRLLVDVEGHGREDLFDDVDLSRTVGWFTSVAPVLLDVDGTEAAAGEAIKRVKEQLRALPRGGIGHGALRRLHPDGEVRARLAALPAARVAFNYLGQVDGSVSGDALFALAEESSGPAVSPRARRTHLLDVVSVVQDGRLRLRVDYGEGVHRRETVQALAERLAAELRAVVAHCVSAGAGGCTPSDFPLAGLDPASLDALVGDGRDVEDVYPLAPMQEGLLFETLDAPDTAVYTATYTYRLTGEVDDDALAAAWQGVVARHPALRTAFLPAPDGRFFQVVRRRAELPLERMDLRGLPEAERRARLAALAAAHAAQGFDPARPPLMRLALVRTREGERTLLWTFHQTSLDGWSLPLLFRDLRELYAAHAAGRAPRLGSAPRYRDYVAWLGRQDPARAEAFWRAELAGFATPTPLGVDRAAGAGEAGFGRVEGALEPADTAALEAAARRHGLTLNTIVQGAWALLLSRYAGEDDVVFGTTASGRPPELPGVEEMVGVFINTLPVRARVEPGTSAVEWLAALQARQAEAREHEHTPLAQVQRWSGVPAGTALFETLLVYENYPADHADDDGGPALAVSADAAAERGNYPLMVAVLPGERLRFHADHHPARLPAATVGRMLEHLGAILRAFAAHPEAPLGEIPLVDASESARLLESWTGEAAPYPPLPVHVLIAERARRWPDADAVVHGGRTLSYAALEARAGALARELAARGVGPERRVALFLDRGAELAVALLAVLKAGGAFVPLDPEYPAERLRYLLDDCGARLVLTRAGLAHALPATAAEVVEVDGALAGEAGVSPDPHPPVPVDPGNLAYALYTSGSTGRPKGAMVSHRALVCYAEAARARLGLAADDRVLQFASPAFDVMVEEVFPAWLAGAAVVFPTGDPAADPHELGRTLAAHGVTTVELPTAFWHEWTRWLDAEGQRVPESVRRVLVGGERVRPDRLAAWARQRVPLVHVFGLTETTVTTTMLSLAAGDGGARWPNLPAGGPLANARLRVLDGALRPAPADVPGELFIGGDAVARGYLGRPALTAERFVPDPFASAPGARLYRTGDRVRWLDEGGVEFLGRMDQQAKVRGFRIEPGEVEAALAAHPGVREAAVAVRPDGASGTRLVAWVVSANGALPAAQLREHLLRLLPAHMVPGVFVPLDALPLSPNGKVDRRALPAPDAAAARAEPVAPRTSVEAALCRLWGEVLGVDAVGVHDDWFALGGDSILAIQVVSRARAGGLHLRPRQLFQHPTVAALAAAAVPASAVPAADDAAEGEAPLTPVQRGFFATGIPARHHWNMPVLLELRRPVPAAVLEAAVRAVAAHHDALRFRYTRDGDGGWRQAYGPLEGAVAFESIGLASVPAGERDAEVERRCARAQASLDIHRGPLLRALHLDLGDGGARLLLAAHHLAMDGVSLRVMTEDLETACGQLARGESVFLPPKTSSFGAWARRLRAHAEAGAFDGERAYWLDPARRDVAALPLDGENADGATAASARIVTMELDEAETRALLTEVPAAYRTQVNDALLSALARAFQGWTGGPRLLVDLEGHGREDLFDDVDTSRTVGWFTTLFPVLLDLEGADGPGGALRAVKEQLRAVPGRGIGHGALRWLSPDAALRAELAALPQPRVRFEYLGQLDGGAAAGEALFRIAPEGTGPAVSPRAPRTHLLEVGGGVLDGRLQLAWTYGEGVHRRETVQALAARFADELRALVAHCRAGGGGVTPSDFPLARLPQAELDALAGDGRGVEDVYPLGPAQEGMLFEILAAPGTGVYVAQLSFELHGALDAAAFAEAWQRTAARHPALRTAFVGGGAGTPLQVVHRHARVPVHTHDWSGLDEAAREARLEAWMAEDRARGMDPAQAPPLRVTLFRLGERRHLAVWTVLQLVVDGWSLPLVLRDVREAYDALAAGREPAAGTAPGPRALAAWLARRDPAASEAYWRAELAGFTAPTPLRVERPGGAPGHAQAFAQADEARTAAVEAAARRQGLTLNTFVQGAWALLLARYAGERDVLFGATVAGRPAEVPGVEETVGVFVNTVPVRVKVDGRARVDAWLREIQARQGERLEHEHTPAVQVQAWSGVPRGLPLFETLLAVENYPAAHALDGAPGLEVRARPTREQTQYPFTLSVVPGPRLRLEADYDRQRFTPAAADRLLGHVLNLLDALAESPEATLGSLEMLDAAERAAVLEGPNRTALPLPAGMTLHGLFEAQARRTPDAVAVIDGERRLSYAELDARAGALGRRLRALGVGPEVRVGVCTARSGEMVAAVLAVLKAGGAYVPLDPAYPAERLAFTLADAHAAVLLTESHLLPRIPEHAGRTLCIDREEDAASTGDAGYATASPALPEATAYLIYTSGSTGRPKGVQIEHRSAAAFLHWAAASFDRDDLDGVLLSTSLCFDLSVFELFLPLSVGGAVIVAENALALPSLPARDQVTLLNTVPSAAAELARAGAIPPGVRVINLAGEPLPRALADALTALPGVRLFNLYGPSEYTTYATWTEVRHGEPGPVSIGLPLANTRVYLLDGDHRPAPLGVPGELCLGGAGLARGYLGRSALTAEKFVPDPFGTEAGARLYRTGDLARWSEGGAGLEFLGRMDHQVKVRGFRIEPGEVEAALEAHPAVAGAVVAVRRDAAGDARLVAWVTAKDGAAPFAAALRAHLRTTLPEPMVPSAFVPLPAFPLTPNGKVDRAALPDPGAPAASPAEHAEPRTATERAVAEIWREVLGAPRVGRDDDFFALGGHSLVAGRVAARVRQRLEVQVPLAAVFDASTLAAFAAEIDRLAADGAGAASAGSVPAPLAAESWETGGEAGVDALSDAQVEALLAALEEDGA